MQHRAGTPPVKEIDGWTHLISIGKTCRYIPSCAEVDAQFFGYMPRIFRIQPSQKVDPIHVRHSPYWHIAELISKSVHLESPGVVVDLDCVFANVKAEPGGVRVRSLVGNIALKGIGKIAVENMGCDALVKQIRDWIGIELLWIVMNRIGD